MTDEERVQRIAELAQEKGLMVGAAESLPVGRWQPPSAQDRKPPPGSPDESCYQERVQLDLRGPDPSEGGPAGTVGLAIAFPNGIEHTLTEVAPA